MWTGDETMGTRAVPAGSSLTRASQDRHVDLVTLVTPLLAKEASLRRDSTDGSPGPVSFRGSHGPRWRSAQSLERAPVEPSTRTGAVSRYRRPVEHTKGAGFLRSVSLRPDATQDWTRYPFTLAAVRALRGGAALGFEPGVTFLVGENGSGKSTLIEAIASAVGFNLEGGSRSFRFSTRSAESELSRHLLLRRSPRRPRDGFFLRAESFYNVATEIEQLGLDQHAAYGGTSPHERSHGESFLDLATHRFGPGGLYVLDEPESALSVRGTMALLTRIHDLVELECQFVVATHSPILLALPGATILQLDDDGVHPVTYADALPVDLTRRFLADPDSYLRHLFGRT